jgi:hypothetical protein
MDARRRSAEWYLVPPAGRKVERGEDETGDAPVPGGYPYGS